jgi:branched-chain amino acid transport system permease protein
MGWLWAPCRLIAIGFALIFNILKFSNFSHGGVMTASAFIGFAFVAKRVWGFSHDPRVDGSGGLIALFGEFIAFRRITPKDKSNLLLRILITLGTLLESLVTIGAGPNFYKYPGF